VCACPAALLCCAHSLLQNGRGYPDVAAQGSRYLIVDGHRYVHVGGTSASSPTFGEALQCRSSPHSC
jgi:hypothetical protein